MIAALIPLLALVGVGIAVATRGAAAPSKAPAPTPAGPATTPNPAQYAAAEVQFFEIRPDGTRVWKPQMREAILQYLSQWGYVLVQPNDPTYVQLVPRKAATDATARQWAELYAATRVVLAFRYLMADPNTPKVLRAVAPGEEVHWAGASPQAAFAVLLDSRQAGVVAQPFPNLPPPPPAPATPDAFTPLGPELADQVRALMRDATDPTKLVLMADSLEGKEPVKYGPAADALRKRARELETQAELQAIQSGRIYIVRPDDLQSELALWYTGSANRWPELMKTNPKLRRMVGDAGDGRKFEYLAPWVAGDRLVLPPGWDVSKGLPPRRPRGEPKAVA